MIRVREVGDGSGWQAKKIKEPQEYSMIMVEGRGISAAVNWDVSMIQMMD